MLKQTTNSNLIALIEDAFGFDKLPRDITEFVFLAYAYSLQLPETSKSFAKLLRTWASSYERSLFMNKRTSSSYELIYYHSLMIITDESRDVNVYLNETLIPIMEHYFHKRELSNAEGSEDDLPFIAALESATFLASYVPNNEDNTLLIDLLERMLLSDYVDTLVKKDIVRSLIAFKSIGYEICYFYDVMDYFMDLNNGALDIDYLDHQVVYDKEYTNRNDVHHVLELLSILEDDNTCLNVTMDAYTKSINLSPNSKSGFVLRFMDFYCVQLLEAVFGNMLHNLLKEFVYFKDFFLTLISRGNVEYGCQIEVAFSQKDSTILINDLTNLSIQNVLNLNIDLGKKDTRIKSKKKRSKDNILRYEIGW